LFRNLLPAMCKNGNIIFVVIISVMRTMHFLNCDLYPKHIKTNFVY